jgi:hypothetical protein
MKYSPSVIIHSSDKPYLYEGESFYGKNCNIDKKTFILKKKNNTLRVLSFNVHNFISRCNQGISPMFDTALNPFETPRDINRFINFFKEQEADVLCLQELVPIYKNHIDFKKLNQNHIKNVKMKDLTHYATTNYILPRGVVRGTIDNYSIVDGYHRIIGSSDKIPFMVFKVKK